MRYELHQFNNFKPTEDFKKDFNKQKITMEQLGDLLEKGRQFVLDIANGLNAVTKGDLRLIFDVNKRKLVSITKDSKFKSWSQKDHKKFYEKLTRPVHKRQDRTKEDLDKEYDKLKNKVKKEISKSRSKRVPIKQPKNKIELRDHRTQQNRSLNKYILKRDLAEHKKNSPVRVLKSNLDRIVKKVKAKLSL